MTKCNKIVINNYEFIYKNHTIVISRPGTYIDADNNMKPYSLTYAEGSGIKSIWDALIYLYNLTKEVVK